MVIYKNTLIFKRQQNTGWKFDWLSVLNMQCMHQNESDRILEIFTEDKKIPISVKSFCVSVYFRCFFIGYFSPKNYCSDACI